MFTVFAERCSRVAAQRHYYWHVRCRLRSEEAETKSAAVVARLADVTAQLHAAHEASAAAAAREDGLAAEIKELLVSLRTAQESVQAEAALRAEAEVRPVGWCCLDLCRLCGARYHVI